MHKQIDEVEVGRVPRSPGLLRPINLIRPTRQRWWGMALAVVLLTTLALVMGQGVVFAQTDAPAVSTNEITPDEVNAVARQLWCPLCSGVRLDACELKACDQMKEMIAIKLSEGEDTESIKAYFVEQYGPQVMGEPPRQGFNWLAWILPVVGLLVGGYIFWRTTQRMMRPASPLGAELASGVVLDATNASSVTTSPVMTTATDAKPTVAKPTVAKPTVAKPQVSDNPDDIIDEDDTYTQKLEEELAKYG